MPFASCSSTYALKRARSAWTARFTKRRPDAIFSIIPVGSNSMSTMTRVRFGASLWKVTTPLCCVPFFVFQAISSFLRRSVISPSLGRLLSLAGQLLHQVRSLCRRDCGRGAQRGRDQELLALERRDELLAAAVR